jgi:hypothetical protein
MKWHHATIRRPVSHCKFTFCKIFSTLVRSATKTPIRKVLLILFILPSTSSSSSSSLFIHRFEVLPSSFHRAFLLSIINNNNLATSYFSKRPNAKQNKTKHDITMAYSRKASTRSHSSVLMIVVTTLLILTTTTAMATCTNSPRFPTKS